MSAVAESITETSPNSEKVMQWTVQYRQMPKVLLRIIQHQHLAQVLSHFRHEQSDPTHAHSKHNMSLLCIGMHESNHETLQQTQ